MMLFILGLADCSVRGGVVVAGLVAVFATELAFQVMYPEAAVQEMSA